ncbi:MAG: hypothetical protein ABEJ79_01265 [Halolamina sp.]
MVWVRSEYAGPLAVVATWLTGLLPWNVLVSPLSSGTVLFVRFPLFQVRYVFGELLARGTVVGLPVPSPVVDTRGLVVSAVSLQRGTGLETAYWLWALGGAVYAVALGLSVAYYLREERVAAGPVDPVRTLGALLGVAGGCFGVATVFLRRGFPGVPLPVGVVVLLVLSGVLVTADRR